MVKVCTVFYHCLLCLDACIWGMFLYGACFHVCCSDCVGYVGMLDNIVSIPKPNKDIDKGTSYRTISILSVIAKTLEMIQNTNPFLTAQSTQIKSVISVPIKDFIHHYPRVLFNDIPRVGAHFYDTPTQHEYTIQHSI